jgi:hypothetical protein
MKGDRCHDCGAILQETRRAGQPFLRCPWSRVERDCDRPFKRLITPDMPPATMARTPTT